MMGLTCWTESESRVFKESVSDWKYNNDDDDDEDE